MKTIGFIAIGISAAIASTIWSGYVLSIIWAWFIVSVFELPNLSIASAIGLSIVIRFMTYQYSYSDFNSDDNAMERFIHSIFFSALFPALALFTGWIVLKYI